MDAASVAAALREGFPGILDAAENASPAEAVEAVTRGLAALLGGTHVAFLIADLSGRGLTRLSGDSRQNLPFDGGAEELTVAGQRVRVLGPGQGPPGAPDERWTVLAPVSQRGETLGLLEMSLPVEPELETLEEIARTAHLLSFVVIANRRHTDVFELGQRGTPFSLPAEIQRRLLPAAFTCEGGSFTISAWLEPTHQIGGDTFDYSVDRDRLHLSLTDAMGHGVVSALIATLCVGSLRNTRRRHLTLVEQAEAANAALLAETREDDGFATGILARLDLRTGVLSLINAGHVAPLLVRDGVVRSIDLLPDLPFGMFASASYTVTEFALLPGDRVVFVTDGMLERNAARLDLITEVGVSRGLHARQATRHLADRVLEATGHALADDATLLVLDWHALHDPAHPGDARHSSSGADVGTRT